MVTGLGYVCPLPDYIEFCLRLTTALVALIVAWSFFVRVNHRKYALYTGRPSAPSTGSTVSEIRALMSLYFGSTLVLVISSPEMAREFMKTHDLLFASMLEY